MTDKKIAVLDIGKTNKKLFVYDSSLKCLNPGEKGVQIDPIVWDAPSGDCLECDDMASIRAWMIKGLNGAVRKYGDIGVISIATHGATVALLGSGRSGFFENDGGLVFPVVSYENPIPESLDEAFYKHIGITPHEAQQMTATPRLSWLLNCAKTVYYHQVHSPNRFQKVTDILMFPQYLGYLLCGEIGVEPTYMGCHGYLLDADGQNYSKVADKLRITDLLPDLPMKNTWDVLGTVKADIAAETGLPPDCRVTMGAHDSNAALVPYLAKGIDDFVVQDSGTWIVTMAPLPGQEARFADEELGLEVFYNRDIYGNPVKTTIFRGGAEFEFYQDNVLSDKERPCGVSDEIVKEIIGGKTAFALPTIERGAGLFPDSVARLVGVDTIFRDNVTAWHVTDIGLAVQGYHALKLSAGERPSKVYIEGNIGRNNPLYRRTIATLFGETDIYYGSMGGAPFGAAILGQAATEDVRPEEIAGRYDMELQPIERLAMSKNETQEYAEEFFKKLKRPL